MRLHKVPQFRTHELLLEGYPVSFDGKACQSKKLSASSYKANEFGLLSSRQHGAGVGNVGS